MANPHTSQPLEYAPAIMRRRSCFLAPPAILLLVFGLACGLCAGLCGLNPAEASVVNPWLIDRPVLCLALFIAACPGIYIGLIPCLLLSFLPYTLGICIGQICVYWPAGALLAYILRALRGDTPSKPSCPPPYGP